MTTLEVCILFMAILCLRLTRWHPGVVLLSFYFIFALLWYNSIRTIINGNIVAIVRVIDTSGFISNPVGTGRVGRRVTRPDNGLTPDIHSFGHFRGVVGIMGSPLALGGVDGRGTY